MPEYVEGTEYIEEPVEQVVEYVEEAPVEYVEEAPVEYVEDAAVTEHPVRRRETLAEAAAEGPLDWPDDGSKAKHQGYIDHDPDWQMRHNPPVVEEHHGRHGILDDDISLGIANELGMRASGMN